MASRQLLLRAKPFVFGTPWKGSRILVISHRCCSRLSVSYFSSSLVSDHLEARIGRGELRKDKAQERAAKWLSRLQQALSGYSNHTVEQDQPAATNQATLSEEKPSSVGPADRSEQQKRTTDIKRSEQQKRTTDINNINHSSNHKAESSSRPSPEPKRHRVPRGLFLHGEVGTGKSMLMDTFFSLARVERKRRVHFHSFLADVHSRIHRLKQEDLRTKGRNFHVDTREENNPIARVAHEIASEISLLCLDEFQVTDIADALILSQFFSVLFARGTVLICTSNRPPQDLYEGGLNRSYFLPFIDLLQRHCIVHEISSTTDYRRLLSSQQDFFVHSEDSDSSLVVDDVVDNLVAGRTLVSTELPVGFRRVLPVANADPNGLVVRFSFDELCNRELGASDYRAIAKQFSVVVLEDVPRLTLTQHDQARRFITLVDELYEERCALVLSAETPKPEHLFVNQMHLQDQPHSKTEDEDADFESPHSDGTSHGELASVRELAFAFQRAASRITEMTSKRWWDEHVAALKL